MNQTIDINTNKFKDYNLLICLLAYNINYIILLYYTLYTTITTTTNNASLRVV